MKRQWNIFITWSWLDGIGEQRDFQNNEKTMERDFQNNEKTMEHFDHWIMTRQYNCTQIFYLISFFPFIFKKFGRRNVKPISANCVFIFYTKRRKPWED
jgi:hypothetical protein